MGHGRIDWYREKSVHSEYELGAQAWVATHSAHEARIAAHSHDQNQLIGRMDAPFC
ncbi:MAG: hypothetical protein ACYDEV_13655 [Acidiferrobacter sp.]